MKFLLHAHKKIKETLLEKYQNYHEKNEHFVKEIADSVSHAQITEAAEKPIEKVEFDISIATILKIVLTVIATISLVSLLEQIGSILLLLFVSVILSAAIIPIIDWAESKGCNRSLAISAILFGIIAFLGGVTAAIVPIVIEQTTALAKNLQDFFAQIQMSGIDGIPFADSLAPLLQQFAASGETQNVVEIFQQMSQNLASNLGSVANNAVSTVFALFGSMFNLFMILFFTFFLVWEKNSFQKFIISLIPTQYHHYIITQSTKIEQKLGAWLRGQVQLCLIMGFIVYLFMSLIGAEYAVTFGLITAMTELVPVVGPLIAGFIIVPIAFTQSFTIGIISLIFFFIINLVESNIITPLVMEKATGLNSLVVIIAMMIGAELLGVTGIIMSVPIATALKVFIEDYTNKHHFILEDAE